MVMMVMNYASERWKNVISIKIILAAIFIFGFKETENSQRSPLFSGNTKIYLD